MITFAFPLILLGLLALPLLWVLLRAVPPAPVLRKFPAVTLLLGLKDEETETDKTPWWLLLLRALAVAAVVLGFAGPVWQNTPQTVSDKPLLVVLNGGWSSAPEWADHITQAEQSVSAAGRAGRDVAVVQLTRPKVPAFGPAGLAARALGGMTPDAWSPLGVDAAMILADVDQSYDTFWVAGPVAFDRQSDVAAILNRAGDVTVFQTGRDAIALRPGALVDDGAIVTVVRSGSATPASVQVNALGLDPNGQERVLETTTIAFSGQALLAESTLNLPAELRDRVTRFAINGSRTAGAVALADDSLKRREIALISPETDGREGIALLSPLHYLRQALVPTSELLSGPIADVLQANPDVLILADVPSVPNPDQVLEWVENGGVLLRFAGPRMAAASFDVTSDDPLLPVRLRAGGRTVGGAMSWGAPKTLQPFLADSPFFGLPVPDEVSVTSQVLAEPGPNLAERAIARLEDGTPLVTRKDYGQGAIVLFHVTANAEWSNLPLSGLFMSMLERLSVVVGQNPTGPVELEGTVWSQVSELDGYGNLIATTERAGIEGEDVMARLSAELPPGQYQDGDRVLARNILDTDTSLDRPIWPDQFTLTGLSGPQAVDLKPWLLLAALGLLMIDVIAALAVSGRLRGSVVAVPLMALTWAHPADAQDADVISAANQVTLANVITGDARQDEISHAGLRGLSNTLFLRTAVEPVEPVGLNLADDQLALFPFIYWPVTQGQTAPSTQVVSRLNRYLKSGGMILFDTRDGNIAGYGTATPEARKLRQLAAGLELPPLSPIPEDHVLTRSFYLLQDFPGRHVGQTIWVERAIDTELADGMPFRNLNDGVTPVVIGGNDWAAAWATTAEGRPLLPVGRGFSGERQREIARRFGVNLIMHVLTGNYKSDQVHVPDLLDRLGQ